jgi:hypothetical protein
MQRSRSLPVIVHCGHHNRPVRATRNAAIDRLVSCEEADRCRAPTEPGGPEKFPRGCAVYPSLTK